MCKVVHAALDIREFERSDELDRRIAAVRRGIKRARRVRKQRRGGTGR
jgi:hypothetical protein